METITNRLSRSLNILSTMGISDVIDVLIVAFIIYQAIRFVRRTNSYNLAKGVILVWGDSCTIRQNDGSKLELDPSGATISSGYFPEEGDTVQITYNLDTMELLDIQLVSRPD